VIRRRYFEAPVNACNARRTGQGQASSAGHTGDEAPRIVHDQIAMAGDDLIVRGAGQPCDSMLLRPMPVDPSFGQPYESAGAGLPRWYPCR
jgi:hypothetical protein